MSPVVKFTLGRVGLFVAVAVVLLPVPLDLLVKLMIALIASFGLQFLVLRKWRLEMIEYMDRSVTQRRAAREKLRSALAGDDADKS
ncbi:MAG TPA: DUF4229 domain-containing protein [Rugosimonospora sp.]|nr:DUF4229 domain-containing protein [Rugosimonospora sp.]